MAKDTNFNTDGIDQILKALKKPPKIRVGVLGSSDHRDGGGSNATIGAAHEFGTSKMPQRSFLRVPITENLNNYLQKAGLNQQTLNETIKTGGLREFFLKIATVAERVVLDAFATGGFGKWAPWKGNYQSKTGNILINDAQLVKSIRSEVIE